LSKGETLLSEVSAQASASQFLRRLFAIALRLPARIIKEAIKAPLYAVYERRLSAQAPTWRKPRHVGIIMDGNRRFARELGFLPVAAGHREGAAKLREVLGWFREFDITVATLWTFSLENFNRNDDEVKALLELFEDHTIELTDSAEIHDNRIRVRYIGQTQLLPASLQRAIRNIEERTRHYDNYELNLAMAYGGREEITDAVKRYLRDQAKDGAKLTEVADALNADSIGDYLYTSGQPEPDLILRTSGEIRLSGFLLWQSVNSEFYFCDTYWPAFRRIDFLRALRSFDERHRRFGR
jgi:short-chain Z-isoprenyl diphosphate synthase